MHALLRAYTHACTQRWSVIHPGHCIAQGCVLIFFWLGYLQQTKLSGSHLLLAPAAFVSPATDTNGLPSEPADLSALPMALHRPIPSDHAVKQQQLDLLHRALPKPSSSPRPDTGVSTVNVCCCLPEQEAASQRERETERERRIFNLFQRPRADELRVTYGSFAPGQ